MVRVGLENAVNPPRVPSDCIERASGRSVPKAGERFWLVGRFYITYEQQLIASCEASAGVCEFDLPHDDQTLIVSSD